jgi:hypothetical protein
MDTASAKKKPGAARYHENGSDERLSVAPQRGLRRTARTEHHAYDDRDEHDTPVKPLDAGLWRGKSAVRIASWLQMTCPVNTANTGRSPLRAANPCDKY